MTSQQPPPEGPGQHLFRSPQTTKAHAVELLEALGTTRDQVAQRLLELGCLGLPGNCGSCPVAVYLMRSDLGLHGVTVLGPEILLFYGTDDYECIEAPAAVAGFVEKFDDGAYAELVKTALAVSA